LIAVIAAIIVTAIEFKLPRIDRSEGKSSAPVVKDAGVKAAAQLARLNRYVDDMRLAHQLSPLGDPLTFKLAQANSLLDRHRPGTGEDDIRSVEWHYLWNQLHAERQTLADHKGAVYWLNYSPDGRLIASAGTDGARIWDAVTGTLRLSIRDHANEVLGVSFSPDSKRLATASEDQTARIWSALDGRALSPPLIHQNKVVAALFTPDGRQLVTADRAATITIWDATNGARVRQFPTAASAPLEGVALSPDGSVLATATSFEVNLWEFPALRRKRDPIYADRGHSFDCVAFSRDGRRYATASGSLTRVRVWDTRTGELCFSATHDTQERVMSVAFSPDDHTLVSTGSDNTARIWDLSGTGANVVLAGHADYVWCGAFAPDGKTLATASKDSTVKLWTLPFERAEGKIAAMHKCRAVGYSADDRLLYTMKDAGACERREADSARSREDLPFSPDKPPVTAVFSVGSVRVASVDAEGTISIGSPLEGKPLIVLPRAAAARPCLAFSSDRRMLAYAARDGSTAQIDCTRSGSTIERLASPGPAPTCLAVWDLRSRRVRGVSRASTEHDITATAISRDGSVCATNGQGTDIWLWDTAALEPRNKLSGSFDAVDCVAFSDDGRTLLSGSGRGSILLWNLGTGRQFFALKSHELVARAVRGLCVVPGGVSAVIGYETPDATWDAVWRTNLTKPVAGN
jgi:WD40 repeat protein